MSSLSFLSRCTLLACSTTALMHAVAANDFLGFSSHYANMGTQAADPQPPFFVTETQSDLDLSSAPAFVQDMFKEGQTPDLSQAPDFVQQFFIQEDEPQETLYWKTRIQYGLSSHLAQDHTPQWSLPAAYLIPLAQNERAILGLTAYNNLTNFGDDPSYLVGLGGDLRFTPNNLFFVGLQGSLNYSSLFRWMEGETNIHTAAQLSTRFVEAELQFTDNFIQADSSKVEEKPKRSLASLGLGYDWEMKGRYFDTRLFLQKHNSFATGDIRTSHNWESLKMNLFIDQPFHFLPDNSKLMLQVAYNEQDQNDTRIFLGIEWDLQPRKPQTTANLPRWMREKMNRPARNSYVN